MYRFVSDPNFTHNETLSGRVTAACVTCRRRVRVAGTGFRGNANISEQKTRCHSGMPCKTCKEKGIACEGFVKRRKPRKRLAEKRMTEAGSPGSRSDASTCSTDLSEIVTPNLSPAEIDNYPPMNDSYDFAPQNGVHGPLDSFYSLWPEPNDESADWLMQYSYPWPDSAPKVPNAPNLLFTASILEEQAQTLRQMAAPNPSDAVSSVQYVHMGGSVLPSFPPGHMQEPLLPPYSSATSSAIGLLEPYTSPATFPDWYGPPVVHASNDQVVSLVQSLPILSYSASRADHAKAGCTGTDGDSGLGPGSKTWNPKFREMIAQLNAVRT